MSIKVSLENEKNNENQFEINRLELLSSMQRASILSNEKYRGIRMVIESNSLKLISSNSEQEKAEEEFARVKDLSLIHI